MVRKSPKQARQPASPEQCREPSVPLRDLDSFNLKPCEVEWLHLFRSLLVQPRENANAAFADLHHRAADYYGGEIAPLIVGATSGLIRALKIERPAPFYFVSPQCAACRQSVCEDEFLVMCAVVSARCGDDEQLHLAVYRLTQSGEHERLVQAARSLAQVMNMVSRPSAAVWHGVSAGMRLH